MSDSNVVPSSVKASVSEAAAKTVISPCADSSAGASVVVEAGIVVIVVAACGEHQGGHAGDGEKPQHTELHGSSRPGTPW